MIQEMLDCRAIASATERLACYDGKVATFATAVTQGDVAVADREQIRAERRSLFGFTGIKLAFGGHANEEPPIDHVDAKLVSFRDTGYGYYEFTLDNGMRWRQTDAADIAPRNGEDVSIRAGALGSFFLRAGKERWVRAARVN